MDTLDHLDALLSKLIGVSEAAKMLSVCENQIRYWANHKMIPYRRIRGARCFHPKDVEAFGLDREVRGLMKRGPKPSTVRAKLELAHSSLQEVSA